MSRISSTLTSRLQWDYDCLAWFSTITTNWPFQDLDRRSTEHYWANLFRKFDTLLHRDLCMIIRWFCSRLTNLSFAKRSLLLLPNEVFFLATGPYSVTSRTRITNRPNTTSSWKSAHFWAFSKIGTLLRGLSIKLNWVSLNFSSTPCPALRFDFQKSSLPSFNMWAGSWIWKWGKMR